MTTSMISVRTRAVVQDALSSSLKCIVGYLVKLIPIKLLFVTAAENILIFSENQTIIH